MENETQCEHEETELIEAGSGRGQGYAIYKCKKCGEEII